MNIWQRLRNAMRWKPQQRIFIGSRQAGVSVTEDTAQAYSAVGACVRIISETLASLPWQVYRKLDVGREALTSNGVNWLLNHQPNPEQTAVVWRRQLLMHFLMWGNGYAEIERGLDGRPVWLWPLLPDRTEMRRSETGELVCMVRGQDGDTYFLPRENVYHLSDGSFDGLMGLSRIRLARRSIGAGIAQDMFTASYYENGASIGGTITQKTGKTLTGEGVKALLKTFNEEHQGPDRARKTLYLDAGMEYTPLSIPLSDAEFMASRHFAIEEICRWFGVPQHLVQMLTETNYAISYSADKNFVEHTLRPIATLMEQEANIRLFGARAAGSIYSKINLSALMRGDPKVRGEWYKSMINAGVMSINEVRELEELNAIGDEGDEHYLQTSMTTLTRIAEGTNITQPQQTQTPNPDTSTPTARAIESFADAVRSQKPPQTIVNLPLSIPAPTVNFQAGDTHIAPAAISIAQPAITVHAGDVMVEPQAITVNTPPVTVLPSAAAVHVEPTPVTVEAPKVTVQAPRVEVAAPQVTVQAPKVTVDNHVQVSQETDSVATYKRDGHGELLETRTKTRLVKKHG